MKKKKKKKNSHKSIFKRPNGILLSGLSWVYKSLYWPWPASLRQLNYAGLLLPQGLCTGQSLGLTLVSGL